MKTPLILAAILLAATPALAREGHRHYRQSCQNLSVGDQECGRSAARNDPFAVYAYDGRLIGRDPDANVRMRLRDEDARFRHR